MAQLSTLGHLASHKFMNEKPPKDIKIEILTFAELLKGCSKLTDGEGTAMMKVEAEIERLMPPKKKVMTVHSIFQR